MGEWLTQNGLKIVYAGVIAISLQSLSMNSDILKLKMCP